MSWSSVLRTPLHCAASCNNVQVCKFLVESGAAVFATTYSDMQTAAEKCEEMEEDYIQCSQFLYGKNLKRNRGFYRSLWSEQESGVRRFFFNIHECFFSCLWLQAFRRRWV